MPSKRKRVAIIGTVGIPASYGGFETLAEQLTSHLADDFAITVYCSRPAYTDRSRMFHGALRKFVPLKANGAQSVPYDILSACDAALSHDTLLVLGVSGAIVLPLLRRLTRARIVVNIDGLEWKRAKWGRHVSGFLRWSESVAVRAAHAVVADNEVIARHVENVHGVIPTLISYGGDHARRALPEDLTLMIGDAAKRYAFSVCRIEPENNIELILEAFVGASLPLVMVGNWKASQYGRELRERFGERSSLRLLDPIYDPDLLAQLRSNCSLYVHGHAAGGTNPSLVEAMSLGLPVAAFDVGYNRATTENEALYFTDAGDLRRIGALSAADVQEYAQSMARIAAKRYTWKRVAQAYRGIL